MRPSSESLYQGRVRSSLPGDFLGVFSEADYSLDSVCEFFNAFLRRQESVYVLISGVPGCDCVCETLCGHFSRLLYSIRTVDRDVQRLGLVRISYNSDVVLGYFSCLLVKL